jgi:histidine decarboxylase
MLCFLLNLMAVTFKGAIDQVDRIQEALNGHPSHMHLDAALFGGYLPHISNASEVSYQSASSNAK